MRNKLCIGLLMSVTVCLAQTNGPGGTPGPLFSLPKSKLIALESGSEVAKTNASFGEPLEVKESITSPYSATATTPEISSSSFKSDFEYSVYLRMDKFGVFDRPERPSDSLIDRSIDAVFRPEVIQIRKVAVSCSLITAIKRRNPLCLLNPIVLNFAW